MKECGIDFGQLCSVQLFSHFKHYQTKPISILIKHKLVQIERCQTLHPPLLPPPSECYFLVKGVKVVRSKSQ